MGEDSRGLLRSRFSMGHWVASVDDDSSSSRAVTWSSGSLGAKVNTMAHRPRLHCGHTFLNVAKLMLDIFRTLMSHEA